MGRLSESASASLDTAVLRGWARGRSAVLVLGEVGFAEAMADLAPTSTLDPVTVPELKRLLPALPAGALIVVSGSGQWQWQWQWQWQVSVGARHRASCARAVDRAVARLCGPVSASSHRGNTRARAAGLRVGGLRGCRRGSCRDARRPLSQAPSTLRTRCTEIGPCAPSGWAKSERRNSSSIQRASRMRGAELASPLAPGGSVPPAAV